MRDERSRRRVGGRVGGRVGVRVSWRVGGRVGGRVGTRGRKTCKHVRKGSNLVYDLH